ncbi:MAG: hypothetical protein MUC67_01885 [Acidobacteria bacterium]|nr:hypothetical protein [Acidobacteriota bacterium]MCU0253250.1 hypothetical protein [Acidobacteriota bacterium]
MSARRAPDGRVLRQSRWREPARRVVSDPSYVLGAMLLIVALSTAWHVHYSRSAGIDFYQFWLVGHAVDAGRVSSVYSLEGREELSRIGARLAATPGGSRRLVEAARTRAIFENFSTPFLYACFGRLYTGDYDADYLRYQFVCFVALAAAVGWFGRALGYRAIAAYLLVVLVVLGFRPGLSDLLVGNVTRLELAAVALALGALRGARPWREVVAGVLFGLLLCFKPNAFLLVALLPLLWLLHRRWGRLLRSGVGILLGAGFAIGASALFFGSLRPWLDWLTAMGRIEAESNLASQSGNFSLARALIERGLPDPSLALTAGLTLAAAIALGIGARRHPLADGGAAAPSRPGDDLFAAEVTTAAVGLGIPLVGFHLAWMHYFVLALPLMFCALRPIAPAASGAWTSTGRWLAALVGTLLLFGGPVSLFQTSGPPPPALQYALGTLLLLAIAVVDLARGTGPSA